MKSSYLFPDIGTFEQLANINIPKEPYMFEVPKPNVSLQSVDFTTCVRISRNQLVQWIDESDKIIVIAGPPTVAKKELVAYYVAYFRATQNGNVMWINGTTDRSIINDFEKIAMDLFYTPLGKKDFGIIFNIFSHFRDDTSLFVFENSSADSDLLHKLFHYASRLSKIIIITSGRVWDDPKISVIKIHGFNYDLKPVKIEVEQKVPDNIVPKVEKHSMESVMELLQGQNKEMKHTIETKLSKGNFIWHTARMHTDYENIQSQNQTDDMPKDFRKNELSSLKKEYPQLVYVDKTNGTHNATNLFPWLQPSKHK